MRSQLCGAVLLATSAAAVLAVEVDPRRWLHTNPALPERAALDRLHLKLAWKTLVPMDGRRDGFVSIQQHDKYVLTQNRSGLIHMLEAETGRTLWRTRVGQAYRPTLPMAFNYRAVFVVNGTVLYALDHDSGRQLWQFQLPEGLSAGPVVDDVYIYLCGVSSRLYCYELPQKPVEEVLRLADSPAPVPKVPDKRPVLPYDNNRSSTGTITYMTSVTGAGREIATGPQPKPRWDTMTNLRLELQPVVSRLAVLAVGTRGNVLGMERDPINTRYADELYRFPLDGAVEAQPSSFEDTAYVGSRDANLYAIDMPSGKFNWRYTAGTAITREPMVTEEDVYIVAEDLGLARVDRRTGEPRWQIPHRGRIIDANPEADRFLAVNPKFVYALDRAGRLLVLDRARGTTLSRYDVRDFTFPAPNQVTDRLFLVAHNGLILCLHDRDYPEPVRHRLREERMNNPVLAVRHALDQPVVEKDRGLRPLFVVIRDLAHSMNVNIVIAERAFKLERAEPISEKMVRLPAGENETLRDVLTKLLTPLEATFETAGGTIFILPAKKGNPMPMPMPMPMN
jgi:outer membrane protein assembly factor BamB